MSTLFSQHSFYIYWLKKSVHFMKEWNKIMGHCMEKKPFNSLPREIFVFLDKNLLHKWTCIQKTFELNLPTIDQAIWILRFFYWKKLRLIVFVRFTMLMYAEFQKDLKSRNFKRIWNLININIKSLNLWCWISRFLGGKNGWNLYDRVV